MNFVVRNLAEQLVEEVRGRILRGEMAPDAPVRQDALAVELGVSKVPLREALGRLEQDGLIRSHANRGFFVAPMSAKEAREVFALRLKLEPEATVMGALKATPEEVELAHATLQRLDRAIKLRADDTARKNLEFHMALIKPSGQDITLALLERLHVLGDRYVCKHLEPLGRDERARDEHHAIFDAWHQKKAKHLASKVRCHIAKTLADLERQLRARR